MSAKLTFIQSSNPRAKRLPVVCFIPGGPGLSSATLRSMDLLSRSFDLAYIDPPGTGGVPELPEPSFFGVSDSIEEALLGLGRKVVLCGHSFGGLYSVELAARGRLDIASFIMIGTPLSEEAYAVAGRQYQIYATNELKAAIRAFDKTPSAQSLASLFANYGRLYFTEGNVKSGAELLFNDRLSVESFIKILPVVSQRTPRVEFISMLKAMPFPKLLIAGSDDLMLPPDVLRQDADAVEAKFSQVAGAGHFSTFDQPEAVARLIEVFINGSTMEYV